MNASTTARTPSHASITARRGRRSATTPPTRVNATRATMNAASTPPSAVADRLTERTAKVSATGTSASPTAEETRPSQSRRKRGSRSGANVCGVPTGSHHNPSTCASARCFFRQRPGGTRPDRGGRSRTCGKLRKSSRKFSAGETSLLSDVPSSRREASPARKVSRHLPRAPPVPQWAGPPFLPCPGGDPG